MRYGADGAGWLVRRALIVAATILVVLGWGGIAHADPAAPTDYRTEVVAIEPPTPGIEMTIIGGDSFVQLSVDRGVDVVVIGYQGEPYLWFRPDGSVARNQRSPSTYLNASRYGRDAPPSASADAEPDWNDVASDGSFAWYDHRAHWMLEIRPAGKSPGDQILESVIPLVVDGADVDVTVTSTWVASPSALPPILGALVGLATVALAFVLARHTTWWPLTLLPVVAAAMLVGWWQYLSMPSETDPRLLWALAPTVAAVAVAAATAITRGLGRRTPASVAVLIAAMSLVLWSVIKWGGVGNAIVPTEAPQWLDRVTVVAALVAGIGTAVVALAQFSPPPATTRTPE